MDWPRKRLRLSVYSVPLQVKKSQARPTWSETTKPRRKLNAMSSLFQTGKIAQLEVPNRLVRSATCEWSCDADGAGRQETRRDVRGVGPRGCRSDRHRSRVRDACGSG